MLCSGTFLGVTSTRGHAGDNSCACCTNLGPSPILTLRRREGAELRVNLYYGRTNFSGFQRQKVPWG